MANNRMWLVHTVTGKRNLLAKYYPSIGWYLVTDNEDKPWIERLFEQDGERSDFGNTRYHLEFEHTSEASADPDGAREALEKIADGPCACGTLIDARYITDPPGSHKCGSCIARAALTPQAPAQYLTDKEKKAHLYGEFPPLEAPAQEKSS